MKLKIGNKTMKSKLVKQPLGRITLADNSSPTYGQVKRKVDRLLPAIVVHVVREGEHIYPHGNCKLAKGDCLFIELWMRSF